MKKTLLFAFIFTAQFSGAQWNPELRLTNDPYESCTSLRRCVAASADTVHVVWNEYSYGIYKIFYKRSIDAGLNWNEKTQMTDSTSDAEYPSIRLSGSVVHLVWCDERDSSNDYAIYYKRSTNGGSTWEEDTRISSQGGYSCNPSIALSGSFVYIVWYAECDEWWEVYYKCSTDEGLTWGDETRLTYDPAGSYLASIAASGSVLHVVWHDTRNGNREIYYKRSIDGGLNWGDDTRLTNSNVEARDPELDVSGSFVHLVWQDNRDGNPEIYYLSSPDEGVTWGEEQRLTNDEAISERPSVIASDSVIHVVWHDQRSGPYQLYYKSSSDSGFSWDEDTLLSKTNYNSKFPSIDFSGNWLHVVWSDLRDGNWEIYYMNKYDASTSMGVKDDFVEYPGLALSIYPNPASRQLTVGSGAKRSPERSEGSRSAVGSLSRGVCDEGSAARLSIVDLYGREIKEFPDISSFPYTMDISGLRNGLYVIRIINEEGETGSAKFLKINE
jgi:hypothetical protein